MSAPIIKWAGGKTQLLPQLLPLVPNSDATYFEPFAGGAALFFAVAKRQRTKRVVLSDINRSLVEMYRAVRDHVEPVIKCLKSLELLHSEDNFYAVRAAFNSNRMSIVEAAAQFIYLNKTCFNGLYRVNSHGEFNVPFGDYKNPNICNPEALRRASETLQNAALKCTDFADVVSEARRGDFVYFDPPYIPLSSTSNFTQYSGAFGEAEHRRLAKTFARLGRSGVRAVLSNSDTLLTRELYAGYELQAVSARRAINSKGGKRGAVGELIVCNWRKRKR